MVEYKKIFLDVIKILFPYFVKFNKDGSILSKNYSKNCAVDGLNKRLIMIIIYNESIFLANDRQ